MSEEKIAHYSRHRTVLSNERTFLAYGRTALTLFVAGITFIRFFGIAFLTLVGYLFIALSIVLTAVGALRYKKTKSHIKDVK